MSHFFADSSLVGSLNSLLLQNKYIILYIQHPSPTSEQRVVTTKNVEVAGVYVVPPGKGPRYAIGEEGALIPISQPEPSCTNNDDPIQTIVDVTPPPKLGPMSTTPPDVLNEIRNDPTLLEGIQVRKYFCVGRGRTPEDFANDRWVLATGTITQTDIIDGETLWFVQYEDDSEHMDIDEIEHYVV